MEKLTIKERKIIHILLKHLMDLKNENAYLKNKAALNSLDNDLPESKVGAKKLIDGVTDSRVGAKQLTDGVTESRVGAKQLTDGVTESRVGAKQLTDGITESRVGAKQLTDGITESRVGAKSVLETLPIINVDGNGGATLYSVFEKGLLDALDDYIKNGDGQNTVFNYYTDFEDAVEERNSASSKIQDATANATLEDTHLLPSKIDVEGVPTNRLIAALRKHLPKAAGQGVHRTIANELLLLHNAGKVTSKELLRFSGLSGDGFRKHLTKLVSYDLVKKLPPSNYVLTDKSNHILLELFGVAKTIKNKGTGE